MSLSKINIIRNKLISTKTKEIEEIKSDYGYRFTLAADAERLLIGNHNLIFSLDIELNYLDRFISDLKEVSRIIHE